MLCDPRPPSQRGLPSNYIWHAGPLDNLPGQGGETALPAQRFSALRNSRARTFAIHAILAQPGAWIRTTWDGLTKSFEWSRPAYPSKLYLQEDSFSNQPTPIEFSRTFISGGTVGGDTRTYAHGNASTRVVAPYAGMLLAYQHFGFVPGPILAGLLGVGFAGCVAFRRRDSRRWQVLLLWSIAAAELVLPVATAQFDNRYVLPALPFAAAAAALAAAVIVPRWSMDDGGPETVGPDSVTAAGSAVDVAGISALPGKAGGDHSNGDSPSGITVARDET